MAGREGPHPYKTCRWHCGLHYCTAPPIFPPAWFVTRMAASTGVYRSSTDPLVMHAWHAAVQPDDLQRLHMMVGGA